MSAISLQDITVTFADGTKGLQNINLDITPHEFIALVGPSGSGKTTLLRTIAGFLHPNQGKVEVGGKDLTGVSPESRGMGMVFQQHAVWPHMSVADNVGYPLKFTKDSAQLRKEKIQRTLELVGLDGFGKRKPASLSGGQRQVVAIARAVYFGARVLILDEPTAALGVKQSGMVLRFIAAARDDGIGVILITHNPHHAHMVVDHFILLNMGREVLDATREEVTLEELTMQMAGGGELDSLAHELER